MTASEARRVADWVNGKDDRDDGSVYAFIMADIERCVLEGRMSFQTSMLRRSDAGVVRRLEAEGYRITGLEGVPRATIDWGEQPTTEPT